VLRLIYVMVFIRLLYQNFKMTISDPDNETLAISRRQLLRGGMAGRKPEFRPPWALSEGAFVERCTRCDACIPACPEGVLTRGSGGFPRMDFSAAGCTFCMACLAACKPGALHVDEPTVENAWSLKAEVGGDCLSARGVVCRACGDSCEVRAIRFRLQTGGRAIIDLDRTLCSGCGACLCVCPTQAIVLGALQEEST